MNKHNSVLLLKSPKVLNDIITHTRNSEYYVNVENFTRTDISYNFKSDKNNKSHYKDIDFVVEKKNKNKNKKKIKNNLFFEKDVLKIEEDLGFPKPNSKAVASSLKITKSKKDNKLDSNTIHNDLGNQETVDKNVYLNDLLTVQELALKLRVSTSDIIKWLFLQGISVTINQLLDISISTLVAEHYAFNILKDPLIKTNSLNNSPIEEEGRLRAPVITLLGHVDHGKTSLLQAIRKDNLSIKEAGNITQSIGSYELLINNDPLINKLIFLDTPGHEAFVSMRKRGADITDIVILVVAADDGLRPQTIEAIRHISNRNLPFIVAINKIDKPQADVHKVEQELLEYEFISKNINKKQIIVPVSSLEYYNIDYLLNSLVSLSKKHKWKSNPNKSAQGTIIEAYLNKKKGPVAQVLIKNGTLFVGDVIVAGKLYGKVKAISNSSNINIKKVESTALADILCFNQVPLAGQPFLVVKNEKEAKMLIRQYSGIVHNGLVLNSRISLEDIKNREAKTVIKKINLIIKTNTRGSIDAIVHTLANLPQEKVQLNLLMKDCGEVSLKDIDLAYTSNSVILVFGLNITPSIFHYAEDRKVSISRFNVIYDLVDYIQQKMLEFVEVEYKKNILGYSRVKSLFTINKGIVAGCFVQSGKLKKTAHFQLKRGQEEIYNGLIDSLKRVKDDVDEVVEGNECGVLCKDYNLWQIEDSLECYELEALEKKL